jgi:DNA polymerase-3 subunit gamma/tau
MSYEVLARKYRPSSFEEVVGQDHVIQALSNSILQERVHQAFIFSGTRGVGKTTLGRILAKCLNCSSSDKPVAIPCNECVNCEEIKLGRALDFYEQDAASQRGIDAMKDLLQTVPQSPANGRYKVYLLDEAHMLTTESFNALLKNLEEPPKHVVFILATTNPEKLPKTVQSRCLQLNLKTVGGTVLSNHLQKILKLENINFDQESIDLISDAASGSVRDALTILDQAIAHGSGSLNSSNVRELLGTIDNSLLVEMINSIINGDGNAAYASLTKIEELSPEYDVILKSIISVLHKVSLEKVLENSTDLDIKNLASDIDEEFCQLLYEIAVNSYSKFSAHPSPKEALEVCILRMLAFNPIHKIESKQDKG